ncbi:14974_t:CDS:2, partial [Racocetra persica]
LWWANDLMSLSYRRPLEKDDLYVLNDARLAKIVTDNFEVEWKKETQKIAIGKNPSLLKALYRVLWPKFYLAAFCRFLSYTLMVASPLILKLILTFVSDAYFSNFYNVLSGKARCLFTNGKITNLMSTDTTHVDFACGYIHLLWAVPIQCFMAL